jgi:glutamine synthetase
MYNAGLTVESSKGECNYGQHEIAFKYDRVADRPADNHVVFKTAAKELADRHGKSLTFMAKFDEREGNSCHIHMSLRGSTARSCSPTTARASTWTAAARRSRASSPGCWPPCATSPCSTRRR